MKKQINEDLEKRIKELHKKYPLFSRQEDLISKVRFWVSQAASSLIPDSALTVAEGCIKNYAGKSTARNRPDNYLTGELQEIVEKAYEEAMKKYRERAERRPTKLMRRGRQYPMSVDKYNEFVDKAWKKHRKPKMHKKGIIGVKWQSPICKPDLENGKYLVYSIDKNADGKYILKLNNPSEN